MPTATQTASIAAWRDEAHVRGKPRSATAKNLSRFWISLLSACSTRAAAGGRASTCGRKRRSPTPTSRAAVRRAKRHRAARQLPVAREATASTPARPRAHGAGRRRWTNASRPRRNAYQSVMNLNSPVPIIIRRTHEQTSANHRTGVRESRRHHPAQRRHRRQAMPSTKPSTCSIPAKPASPNRVAAAGRSTNG